LDQFTKESILAQILSGKYLIYNRKGRPYIFKEPDKDLFLSSRLRYERQMIAYEKVGFLSSEEEDRFLKKYGIWTDKDTDRLNIVEEDIKKLRSGLKDLEFRSKEKERVRATISMLQEEQNRLINKKNSLSNKTCEYAAMNDAFFFLIGHLLYEFCDETCMETGPVYSSYADFLNNADLSEVQDITRTLFYDGIFSEAQIRAVCRSEPWLNHWRSSKKLGSDFMFDCVYSSLSPRFKLLYWSAVYDSVFESMDCPSYDVIKDDTLLDEWLINRSEEMDKKSSGRRKGQSGISKNPKINNAKELFVAVDTKEDARKVYNELNDQDSKGILHRRQQAIESKGSVKEGYLPDVSQDLQIQRNNLLIKQNKKK
jgi:hypothetical protein